MPETALRFAKQIMGWDDAYIAAGSINAPASDDGQVEMGIFHYTDLNQVMAEVEKWTQTFHLSGSFTSTYKAVVTKGGMKGVTGRALSDDKCQALMLACLSANEKMKEQP